MGSSEVMIVRFRGEPSGEQSPREGMAMGTRCLRETISQRWEWWQGESVSPSKRGESMVSPKRVEVSKGV